MMSIVELNSTARDLMSVRAMIAELEAEAEVSASRWTIRANVGETTRPMFSVRP